MIKRCCLIVGLLLLAACGSTPTDRWIQQREAVTTAQDVALDLHGAGVIDDADLIALNPWVVSARTYVNLAYPYLPDGGPEFDSNLLQAADNLARVRKAMLEAQDAD